MSPFNPAAASHASQGWTDGPHATGQIGGSASSSRHLRSAQSLSTGPPAQLDIAMEDFEDSPEDGLPGAAGLAPYPMSSRRAVSAGGMGQKRPDDLETTLQGLLEFDSPFKSLGQPKEPGPQTLVCNITLPQQGQQAQQKGTVPDQAKPTQHQDQSQSIGQQQEPTQESEQASGTVNHGVAQRQRHASFSSWLAFVLCIPRDPDEDGYIGRSRDPSHDGSEHDFLSAYQRAQQVPVRAPSIRRRPSNAVFPEAPCDISRSGSTSRVLVPGSGSPRTTRPGGSVTDLGLVPSPSDDGAPARSNSRLCRGASNADADRYASTHPGMRQGSPEQAGAPQPGVRTLQHPDRRPSGSPVVPGSLSSQLQVAWGASNGSGRSGRSPLARERSVRFS